MTLPHPERRILHADMDAFYASIEQRDDPQLRGRPVVVGGLGHRGVVSAASYEARAFGIHSAMPTAVARRLCPRAHFLTPRMQVYVEASKAIRAIFDAVTPLVEPLSLDEAFMDITGTERLFGSPRDIATRMKAEIHAKTGLIVSIGIAGSKFVAKVASDLDKPDGLVEVPAGSEADFLAPLPLSRLWGAGKKTQEKLSRIGLRSIGDVAKTPEALLRGAIGDAAAAHFKRLAQGLDRREVESSREAKSIGNERTFERDLTAPEEVKEVLCGLCESVGRRLRQAGVAAGTIRLKLRHPPFETLSRQKRLPRALRDDRGIEEVAQSLLNTCWDRKRPIRLIGVTGADLEDGAAEEQLSLFESVDERQDRIMDTVDRIREKFGDGVIGRGRSGRAPLPREITPADRIREEDETS